MRPMRFREGQRWISEGEPDLGVGAVVAVSPRTVTVFFGACGERRAYGLDSAPLRRVRFRVGETLRDRRDAALVVLAVAEREGLLYYQGADLELCERELSDHLTFSDPQQRLLAGQGDPPAAFALRLAALEHQHRRRQAPVRGLAGGRIELLPHQLHIAAEVTARLAPRVLLADEVGLGKTIEAGLILHRLLLTGRARRVLILLPDSLIHQWFLELLRRFNLWFSIFDEERCQALEAEGGNPFLDDQLVLCGLSLLTGSGDRARQALEAGWDLLVVDEAHHLGAASPGYAVVAGLSAAVPGLLLLTATPEQLGLDSHFARLRLLDPERFHDRAAFLRQSEAFRAVAALAGRIGAGGALEPAEAAALAALLQEPAERVQARLGSGGGRQELLAALLDRHGTGRVMFRNTRAAMTGFPKRRVHLAPLEAPEGSARALAREFAADTGAEGPGGYRPDFAGDPRIHWLAELLRHGDDKILLICRTRAKAEAIEAALGREVRVKMAVFHEGLTLVQRDRGAAWFGERHGARLLICSEIGSEGRNFQFARHLVLFDLPLDPDLLEQRIGRLDRIGQAAEIQVHVPYLRGGPQEVLAQWYHEGLDAFRHTLQGGRELLERFRPALLARAQEGLLEATREAREELRQRLEQGRDRLLELHSFRPEAAAALVAAVRAQDADTGLDAFLLAVFEHFFISVDEVGPRTYQLGSMGVLAEAFPGLPAEGLTVTCDRRHALEREDLQWVTWDHPLVTGALDLLLGSATGNAAFSRWLDPKGSGLYLEAVFVLVCAAPARLQADRFLAPTPLRVVVDHRGQDCTAVLTRERLAREARAAGGSQGLLARPEVRDDLLPRMVAGAEALAAAQATAWVARARAAAAAQLEGERERLDALCRVNGGVGQAEVGLLRELQGDLDRHLQGASLRLDAVHLIHRTKG